MRTQNDGNKNRPLARGYMSALGSHTRPFENSNANRTSSLSIKLNSQYDKSSMHMEFCKTQAFDSKFPNETTSQNQSIEKSKSSRLRPAQVNRFISNNMKYSSCENTNRVDAQTIERKMISPKVL